MKIIFDDFISILYRDIIITNIDTVLAKIKNRDLSDDDFDMIISHLDFYKNLLIEAKKHGKND